MIAVRAGVLGMVDQFSVEAEQPAATVVILGDVRGVPVVDADEGVDLSRVDSDAHRLAGVQGEQVLVDIVPR